MTATRVFEAEATVRRKKGTIVTNTVNHSETSAVKWEGWDHEPGDPVRTGCLDPATGQDLRLLESNQPSSYGWLPEEERAALQSWILEELCYDGETGSYSSYGLKHLFEGSQGGFYVTNGQFKGAMLAAGYMPMGRFTVNWTFGYRAAKGEFAKRKAS